MKKALIIILVIVLIAAGAVAGIFWFKNSGSKSEDNGAQSVKEVAFLSLVRMNTLSELEEGAKQAEIKLTEFNDGAFKGFSDIPLYGMKATAFFSIKDGKVNQTGVKFVSDTAFNDKTKDKEKKIGEYLESTVNICDLVFGEETNDAYHIYHTDGHLIDQSEEEINKNMAEGKAEFLLTVKEKDKTFWKVSAHIEEEKYVIYMERYFDTTLFGDDAADVILK